MMNHAFSKEIKEIKTSLEKQEQLFQDTLILNPVENIPRMDILLSCTSFLHGLYNTDTIRNNDEKSDSKIQFSGRDDITKDVNKIYKMWCDILKLEHVSIRLFSGLHAHIVLFMGLTHIGDKVMVLPVEAGGHMSGRAILQRLGLHILDIPYDMIHQRVDKDKCISEIQRFKPDVIFIDRSEGLIYEDFSWLNAFTDCYKIFDASQYLTNIISGDYKNPMDMGFDIILSTLHKNLPGPQRALIGTNNKKIWETLRPKISTYVSNMHVHSIYSAGLILEYLPELQKLSQNMLINTLKLEESLILKGLPMIRRIPLENEPPTHHCWVSTDTQQSAFEFYLTLEQLGILTNYRLLPYALGLGLSAATYIGLCPSDIEQLSEIISAAYHHGYSEELKKKTLTFIHSVKASKGDIVKC